jgi:hypothetical protein
MVSGNFQIQKARSALAELATLMPNLPLASRRRSRSRRTRSSFRGRAISTSNPLPILRPLIQGMTHDAMPVSVFALLSSWDFCWRWTVTKPCCHLSHVLDHDCCSLALTCCACVMSPQLPSAFFRINRIICTHNNTYGTRNTSIRAL